MHSIYKILFILITIHLMISIAYSDASRLSKSDVINITVDGEKELSKNYQINNDGTVDISLIEPVKVSEMNVADAAAEITSALSKILVNPQVTVTYVDRVKMQVFVVGQVKTPGAIQLDEGDHLIQALSKAGYDETADLSKISIRRGETAINADMNKYLKAEDLSSNIELISGDTVVVPPSVSAGAVTLTGQITRSGPISLKSGMTFRDAIGLSGGATTEADTEKITVKRENINDPIKIDYSKAMNGDPSANIELKPGDIIFIPEIETAYFTVMGGVQRPGQFPLKGKMTLSAGIGLAGGALPETGDIRNVTITRNGNAGNGSETITVNLKDIINGKKEEIMLQRGDVIYVKERKKQPGVGELISNILSLGWLFN